MSRGKGSAVKIPSYQFRRLLEDTPLTDREVAEALEVSQTTVRRWRIGDSNPSVADCLDLAELHEEMRERIMGRVSDLRDDIGKMETILGGDDHEWNPTPPVRASQEKDWGPHEFTDRVIEAAETWETVPGIYCLVKDGEIVYVGQSTDLYKRVGEHYAQDVVDFDRVTLIREERRDVRTWMERTYLRALNPRYNKVPGIDDS